MASQDAAQPAQMSAGAALAQDAAQPASGQTSPALVFMCSGQGSQKPGMGADLLGIPEVARVFACATDVFGRDMARLVREADEAELNDTRNAQAAIATLSVATGRALMSRGVSPDALVGFSLGQTSALALSDMLSDEEAFALVAERSRIMGEVAAEHPGAMSALLKADEQSVRALCEECAQEDVLVPANFNCPGQIVIAGTPAAVRRAEEAWAARKGRFSRLATAGGFHSPLMADACAPFAAFLDTLDFRDPRVPGICNTDAAPLDAATVRARLVAHLTHPVRFEQSIGALARSGARTFVEVGFGGVLANLVKRIDKSLERACVQDRKSFDAALDAWSAEKPS